MNRSFAKAVTPQLRRLLECSILAKCESVHDMARRAAVASGFSRSMDEACMNTIQRSRER